MIYVKKENNEIKAFSEQKENTIAVTEEQWTKSNYGMYCDIVNNEFIIIEPVIDLEKLKKEKLQELKQKRDEYKKTIFIKDGYTLDDFKINSNNYANLIRLKHGWIQEDLNKFDFETDKFVKKYDIFKAQIDNSKTSEELETINIDFNESNNADEEA